MTALLEQVEIAEATPDARRPVVSPVRSAAQDRKFDLCDLSLPETPSG
jgi:hypothetical protein